MSDTALIRATGYRRVIAIAVPVVLSNVTIPLQGAIDTAIIGNLGHASYLAAVTLGAAMISLLFSAFNFLQTSASGLSAQALGSGDFRRVLNTLVRALVIALVIAVLLNLFQRPLGGLLSLIFEASPETEALAVSYFLIVIWGAPAHLGNYALMGWFTGQELTRRLFEMQLVTSLSNIALNLLFVLGFGWGVEGVALGTAIAAYLGLAFGGWRALRRGRAIAPAGWRLDWGRILDRGELSQLMALNRDIFIRTILLVGGFAWVARLGSTQGDVVLAANGVLIQFLHISAYALDGFAMAAETLVGQALGARSRARLREAVIASSLAAFILAVLVAAVASVTSGAIVRLFTNVEEVRAVANAHVLWVSLLPVVSVWAFQFDGIFIGATEGRLMRNAMLISAGVFFPLAVAMTNALGNHGLWASVWVWMALRALTLAWLYPAIERRAEAAVQGVAPGQAGA